MSTTTQQPRSAQVGDGLDPAALSRSGSQIAQALDLAGDRIPAPAAEQARADLEQVGRRLRLGVGHTVVALAGGTGSGKSSLFNAISGLDFADVGVIRPTTAQTAACTWGSKATELLDFLGVAESRRIQRESLLDHDDHADLHGLVLLDLPDHDSVEHGHARQVDRLLPLVDLLIWVVDPQKYADNVLHEQYLRSLAERQDSMLVVVNQIDTIPAQTQDEIRQDVARLLAEDGLADPQILLTSIREEHGIQPLIERISLAVSTPSVSARTARLQLEATAKRLGEHVGDHQPEPDDAATTAENLATASGVAAVSESIRAAVASPGLVALSPTGRPARSRIDAIRERWIAKATAGLPERWQESVTRQVPPATSFYNHLWRGLSRVDLPDSTEHKARWMRALAQGIIGLGVLALLAAAVLAVLLVTDVVSGLELAAAITGGAGVAALLAGVLLRLMARRRRRAAAAERGTAYLTAVTDELRQVVITDLIEPTREPLAEHDRVRQALLGI